MGSSPGFNLWLAVCSSATVIERPNAEPRRLAVGLGTGLLVRGSRPEERSSRAGRSGYLSARLTAGGTERRWFRQGLRTAFFAEGLAQAKPLLRKIHNFSTLYHGLGYESWYPQHSGWIPTPVIGGMAGGECVGAMGCRHRSEDPHLGCLGAVHSPPQSPVQPAGVPFSFPGVPSWVLRDWALTLDESWGSKHWFPAP